MKTMDSSSPLFTSAALLGTAYPTISLKAVRLVEGGTFAYLSLTLYNSFITSYQTGSSAGVGLLPREQFSIQPSSVLVEAFEQDGFGSIVRTAHTTVTCQKPK
jgi:type VI protein secretion system component Hcp